MFLWALGAGWVVARARADLPPEQLEPRGESGCRESQGVGRTGVQGASERARYGKSWGVCFSTERTGSWAAAADTQQCTKLQCICEHCDC